MNIFESLENLNVSEECFDEIMGLVEEYISETSNEKAHAASEESHKRYNNARNAYDTTKTMIDRNKKNKFFSAEEIKELKDKLKQQKQELKNAERISVRDNKNQFNRDKRLK